MQKAEYSISSINRAFSVLEVLALAKDELGITEIATRLGVYKSTVARTLSTLESNGYVYQNKSNTKFGLGIRLYHLGLAAGNSLAGSTRHVIEPFAKELVERYEEIFNYSRLNTTVDFPSQLLVYKYEPVANILKFSPQVGSSSWAHCSATGKALLAYCEPEYLQRMRQCELKRFTANTVCDWETLLQELEQVRKQGYAIDNEELEIGLTCVGVPIINNTGQQYAISVSGSTNRIRSYPLPELVAALQTTASKIARHMFLQG